MPYEDEFAHYKPLRRIAESEQVKKLLGRARLKPPSSESVVLNPIELSDMKPSGWSPDYVVAIDGSNTEVPVKNGYPTAAVGYVTVASVLLDVAKMTKLDQKRPIDPREFRTIENAESIDSALPGSNIVIDRERDALSSFRRSLFELFSNSRVSEGGETIRDTYEALISHKNPRAGRVQRCPYDDCVDEDQMYFEGKGEYCCRCSLSRSLFSTDALRIHEFMNPEGNNPSIFTETMFALERLWIVHFLRTLENENMLPVLRRLAIVLDGPLAIFGAGAWLANSIGAELARINQSAKKALNDPNFDLLLIGIEKTGAFMEHLEDLDKGSEGQMDALRKQSAILLNDAYIKQRIVFSSSDRDYGRNTYFGRKGFYKTASGALIVFNSPMLTVDQTDLKRAEPNQFPRLTDTMSLLDKLVSARYRNSLMPLISAHAEAAIPMNLGKRVLENLARKIMLEGKANA